MVRFAMQPDSSGCGPTAILNLMKWVGLRYSLRHDYRRLFEGCETDSNGTTIHKFDRVLKDEVRHLMTSRLRRRPTLKMIDDWLKVPERAVILLYYYNKHDGHYTLLTERLKNGKTFVAINDEHQKSVSKLSRENLKKKIRIRRREKYDVPVAWFIKLKLD